MTKAEELLELADRCEREEGSRALDAAIKYAVGIKPRGGMPKPYTTSLDAAAALKPRHWYVADINQTIDGWNCTLTQGIADPLYWAEGSNAPTEAMARCAAALRARAAVSHQNPSAMRAEGEPPPPQPSPKACT